MRAEEAAGEVLPDNLESTAALAREVRNHRSDRRSRRLAGRLSLESLQALLTSWQEGVDGERSLETSRCLARVALPCQDQGEA